MPDTQPDERHCWAHDSLWFPDEELCDHMRTITPDPDDPHYLTLLMYQADDTQMPCYVCPNCNGARIINDDPGLPPGTCVSCVTAPHVHLARTWSTPAVLTAQRLLETASLYTTKES